MGEVAAEDQLPSLLITNAPRTRRGRTSRSSSRSAPATWCATGSSARPRAATTWRARSSTAHGLQRGHFHTACRILPSTSEAPDSAPAPAFFLATQDNGGGKRRRTRVTIDVPGTAIKTAGVLQCTSWAGDGSHRTPMMSRANQTPAIDSVRIIVVGAASGASSAGR